MLTADGKRKSLSCAEGDMFHVCWELAVIERESEDFGSVLKEIRLPIKELAERERERVKILMLWFLGVQEDIAFE